MLEAVSQSALSGAYAASRRSEAATNEVRQETRTGSSFAAAAQPGGAPSPGAAPPPPPPSEGPRPVEETGATSRDTETALRSTAPSYLSTLDPSVSSSEGSDSVVADLVADAARDSQRESAAETEVAQGRARSEASERTEADRRAIQANSELVRRLYDLGSV
jgi:hypothetical protein